MDQNKKTLRSFQCRDYLWEIFGQMSAELECSVDYLINEAMRQYARSRNYGVRSPSTPGMPSPRTAPPPPQAGPPPGPPPAAPAIPSVKAPSRPPIPSAPPPPRPGYPTAGAYGAAAAAPGYPPQSAPPQASPPGYGGYPSAPQGGYPPAPPYSAPPAYPPQAAPPAAYPPQAPPPGAYPPAPPQRPSYGGAPPRPSAPPPLPSSAAPGPMPGAKPTLFVIFNGQKIPVTKDEFIIGRGSKTADLPIKDGNISRRHAAVVFQGGAFYIKDLGSTNGIEHLGRRIDSKRIDEGDVFAVCDYEIRFTYR
ncbi:MAG: FHA domain-containing protein [Sandaracinus sp.]|nr:FHA domain-containing protein [Sandaracinus sp.]MCB9620084.1 FHA domain-containing protein [Sandaracinus sp.]